MTMDQNNNATLFRKLSEVTGAIRHIPKNGYNAHFGYKFATDADVSAALSKELSERSVQTFVSSGMPVVTEIEKANGKKTLLTHVGCTVTFACGETGATFSVDMPGTGIDNEDKGTYKAITGAVKYALLKTFLIATGDDPEHAAGPAPDATQAAPNHGVQAVQQAFNAAPAQQQEAGGDDYTFTFGKHNGTHLRDVEASYLDWLLRQPAKPGYEQQHADQHAMFRRELYRREQQAA